MAAIVVTDARGNQTRFELPAPGEPSFTIGTAADCSASLPRVIGLAAHHARIDSTPDGYVLTAAPSSRGIMLDGEPQSQVPLQPHTTYGLGNATLEFLPKEESPEIKEQYSSLLKKSVPKKWKTIAMDAGILLTAFGMGLLIRHIIVVLMG